MKLFSKKTSIPRPRLIKYAVFACIFTIAWNITEGVVSIYFGSENDSVSLVFFGIDSFIEVSSAGLVLWRFLTESKPDEEKAAQVLEENLGKERKATMGIGLLFLLLSVATIADAIVALVLKRAPESAIAGLIISSVSLSFMGFLWLSKKYLAKMLDSSTMASDAQCSLACIKITLVLFIGSLLYMVWKGGWWLDSAAAIILGILFAKEGVDMILWARSKNFSGGCCQHDVTEKKNRCEDEGGEKCCGENNETTQKSCCVKEIKDSTDKVNAEDSKTNEKVNVEDSSYEATNEKVINVEISTPEEIKSQDKIDVVKSEEKGSSCACCHE